ncbi:hypothetical protein [Sphingomonas sp.]
MEIVRLQPGGRAPDGEDHVHINSLPNARHGWTGVAALGTSAVFGIGKNEFSSRDAAETEAIAWADGHGVTRLYVETDNA